MFTICLIYGLFNAIALGVLAVYLVDNEEVELKRWCRKNPWKANGLFLLTLGWCYITIMFAVLLYKLFDKVLKC